MTTTTDPPRAELVLTGEIVVSAGPGGLETAESVAVGGGRVVAVGPRAEVLATAPGAREVAADGVVVPGIHDFHLHLIGMARALREVTLDELTTREAVSAALLAAAEAAPPGTWVRGRGWREGLVDTDRLNRDPRFADRSALVYSHDSHSAWASPAALQRSSVEADAVALAAGIIERDSKGAMTGILRERATKAVETAAERLDGQELTAALGEALQQLAGLGITGATDAGDSSAENGAGPAASLGDRASRLIERAPLIDGRLRLSINVPAGAIEAAAELGMATGRRLPGATTLRAGWAKAYADGALGSRTAALFEPYTCGDHETGILTLGADELDDRLGAARRHAIGVAVHAIGDRAAAGVIDAFERAGPDAGRVADRVEHLQLLRTADWGRLARLRLVSSVQPVHCASDRAAVEECWADRADLAYPWRGLVAAGARIACGSDAPIESVNPWLGIFCAVHRRFPGDLPPDWNPSQALSPIEALAAYTHGPAAAIDAGDEGHLGVGAHADLAMLNVDLATLLAADDRLAGVRSLLTLVGGQEAHRA